MSRLILTKVETSSELRGLSSDWRALEEATENRLPFRTFEWVESWWRHFPERRLSVTDSLAVWTARDEQGALVATAPLMLTQRPSKGPFRARCLQFVGADPNITELRGPLVLPAHEADFAEGLWESLQRDLSFDWMQWSGVAKGSELERVLLGHGEVEWRNEIPNFILPLAPSWDEFRSGLKHNIRESLRKCYNSLKRDNHEFTLEVVEKSTEIYAALEHFFRLHAMRADVSGTIKHRNVFDSGVARAFLIEVCERMAERGSTRVFLMKIGGEVIAMRIGFILRDSIYMYYSGYDPAWSKYSVMTTVVAEAFKYAMANGLKTANLSTGNDVSKTRWGPEERVYREAIQHVPSPKSRLAHQSYQWLQKAKQDPRVQGLLSKYLGRRQGP